MFQHFPSNEAPVFDQDQDREAPLVAAVTTRAAHQSMLDALQAHFRATRSPTLEPALKFGKPVRSTPALRAYAHRIRTRHEASPAQAIADSTPSRTEPIGAAALARFSLKARNLTGKQPDPHRALTDTFTHLRLAGATTAATHPRAHAPRNAAMASPVIRSDRGALTPDPPCTGG